MHIALWTTGLAALACIGVVVFLSLLPIKNADDESGRAFLAVLVGIAGVVFSLSWIVLVVFKAASA